MDFLYMWFCCYFRFVPTGMVSLTLSLVYQAMPLDLVPSLTSQTL